MNKNIIKNDKDFSIFLKASLDDKYIPTEWSYDGSGKINSLGINHEYMGKFVAKIISSDGLFSPSQQLVIHLRKKIPKQHKSDFWSEEIKNLYTSINIQIEKPLAILNYLKRSTLDATNKHTKHIDNSAFTMNYIDDLNKLHSKYGDDFGYSKEDLRPIFNSVKLTLDYMVHQQVDSKTDELKHDLIDGLFDKIKKVLPKSVVRELYRYSFAEGIIFSENQIKQTWPVSNINSSGCENFMNAVFLTLIAINNPEPKEESPEILAKLLKKIFNHLIYIDCESSANHIKEDLLWTFYENVANHLPSSYHKMLAEYIYAHKDTNLLPEYKFTAKVFLSLSKVIGTSDTNPEETRFTSSYLQFNKEYK